MNENPINEIDVKTKKNTTTSKIDMYTKTQSDIHYGAKGLRWWSTLTEEKKCHNYPSNKVSIFKVNYWLALVHVGVL